MPFFFTERPDALAAIGEMLQPGQMLVTGAVREEASGSAPLYYNSVIAIDDSGEIVDAVDKVHLVPFGEYIPFADVAARLGIGQLVAGPMNFVAGNTAPSARTAGWNHGRRPSSATKSSFRNWWQLTQRQPGLL